MSTARPATPPVHAVREAVSRALAEDLTPLGDLTASLIPAGVGATATLDCREDGVLAGCDCVTETFAEVDADVEIEWSATDGDALTAGTDVARIRGRLASILTAERTALNFVGHLSGVATNVARYVAAAGPDVVVWDTRKTLPGLRALEKAAVRAGGGASHRGNLSEWVMLKDNHLAVLPIAEAVDSARSAWPGRTIHVECDRLDQVRQAATAGADALLLDNMTPDEVREAVKLAREILGDRRCWIEASGGITLETIGTYGDTGVDAISSGALTNSAPVLDLGLDITADDVKAVDQNRGAD